MFFNDFLFGEKSCNIILSYSTSIQQLTYDSWKKSHNRAGKYCEAELLFIWCDMTKRGTQTAVSVEQHDQARDSDCCICGAT